MKLTEVAIANQGRQWKWCSECCEHFDTRLAHSHSDVPAADRQTYPCCNGTTSHAPDCISTPRMLAAESVTFTSVVRHETTIDEDTPAGRHRWSCSCGKQGRWVTRRFQAEQGAVTHRRRST